MLTRVQRWWVAGSALAAAFAVVVLVTATIRELPPAHLRGGSLLFQPLRAMQYTAALSIGYPRRFTGTQTSRQAAQYLARQFEALGYRVRIQRFSLWIDGKRKIGENVIATLPFVRDDAPYVVALAHYDSPRTSPYAAEDDASGIGTLLELARVLRHRITRPIFVATDAEELGMLGARALVPYLRSQGNGAAVAIDYVNAGDTLGLQIYASGQFSGYTPLWLRVTARTAEAQQTRLVLYPYGLTEWIDRSISRSFQDQGPLLRAGIPAVDVCTVPKDRHAAMARYHTPQDVYAAFTSDAFAMTGRSVERLMLTVASPGNNPRVDGFMLTPSHAIGLRTLAIIQFIALMPLLLATLLVSWNGAARLPLMMPALAAPLVAAYAVATQVAAHTILLPRYELYPPPPKDPLLYNPPVPFLLVLAALIALGYAIVLRRKRPAFVKSGLFCWTTAVLLAAFVIQSFGAWLYLGLLGYAALLFVDRPGRTALALNLTLCAVAAAPFVAVIWFYASEMWLGPYVFWYLLLQSVYGVWSPWVVITGLFAAVIWVQFVRFSLTNARETIVKHPILTTTLPYQPTR